jgi:hypothetical protein
MDPSQAFQTLADAHLVLKYGDPQQRAEYAKQIINDYNLAEFMQQGGQPAVSVPPQLMSRLDSLEAQISESKYQENIGKVEKFFSNPENKYAGDVVEDMMRLLKTGAADSLDKAYELAIYQNPAVRSKLIEEQAMKIASTKKPAPRQVRSSGVPPSPTGSKDQSIDETLNSAYEKIVNR